MLRLFPLIALLLAACSPVDEELPDDVETGGKADSFAAGHPLTVQAGVYGHSVDGRMMVGESFGSEGPTMFLLAAIHGGERGALTFGERVRTMLLGGLAERMAIRIFFVQAANPDGIALDERNNANDIDLNRNFPAPNFDAGGDHGEEPLTEPESQMLHAALNATAPVGVVSMHCCIPTFDLDGPALGLAAQMQAALADEGLDWSLEGLPAYGGSMGSYVSQILEKPIVTVEFDWGDDTPIIPQLEAMEASIEAAADWTAQQAPTSAFEIDALEQAAEPRFDAFEIGLSASGLSIRAELIGEGARKTALIAGLDGSSRRSEFVAEHVRRTLISEASAQSQTLVVTGVNPDGLGFGVAGNSDGQDVREDFGAVSPTTDEARATRDALRAHAPEVTVVFIDSGRDSFSVSGPLEADLTAQLADAGGAVESMSSGQAVWVGPLVESGTTVVLVEIASDFAETQTRWDDPLDVESPSIIGAPLLTVLR